MRVLSLREPYASLIKEKIKTIETRSFKTNYRGALYIHASKAKINLKDERVKEAYNLLKNKELNYGYIILKCNLVDCIYMDKKYIEKIKQNKKEYLTGLYEEGRYAWILEDIEPLDENIPAQGKLNIWHYEP